MKNSHFTTPRKLEDCQFAHNADPIERPSDEPMDWRDKMVCWVGASCILAVLFIIYWP